MVRSVLELYCTIVVVRYTSTVLYLHRVAFASSVADRCYTMEDTFDPYST